MIKVGFLMIVVANAIWMTPHGFVATQGLATEELELPSWASELALMPAKNAAAFTLVFLTVVNYILYNRAIRSGTIIWGKIDFTSQFVLIFLAFSAIWTMGLMGTVRSLTRENISTCTTWCRTLPRKPLYAHLGLFRLVDYGCHAGLLSRREFCHYRDVKEHRPKGGGFARGSGARRCGVTEVESEYG